MKLFKSIILLSLVFLFFSSKAQDLSHLILKDSTDKLEARFMPWERYCISFGYNFLQGKDAKDFPTTINGCGSGFLFGMSKARIGWDWLSLDYKNYSLNFGAGIALTKFRFSDPVQFSPNQDRGLNYSLTLSEGESFNSNFFSHDKSKLRYWSLYLPIHFTTRFKKVVISAGAFADVYLGGKTKFKYHKDGNAEKESIRLYSQNGPVNPVKFGFNFEFRPLLNYFMPGIGYTFMVDPLFKPGKGPELYEHRISLIFQSPFTLCNIFDRKIVRKNGKLKFGPSKCGAKTTSR